METLLGTKAAALVTKKQTLRIIDGSHYIAHTEPICKKLQVVKLTDMF